jgi:hypothetical protein
VLIDQKFVVGRFIMPSFSRNEREIEGNDEPTSDGRIATMNRLFQTACTALWILLLVVSVDTSDAAIVEEQHYAENEAVVGRELKLQRSVKIRLAEECTGPTPDVNPQNGCSFSSGALGLSLIGQGFNDADIAWGIDLFSGNTAASTWQIQFQAFSEDEVECQYEIEVKGSYWTVADPDNATTHVKSKQSIDTGILFDTAGAPEQVTLLVKTIKIWPDRFSCGR